MAAAPANPAPEKASDRQDMTPTRALDQPAAAMASDKSAVSDANRPAAQ
jgi:hypothetical protein